MPYEVLVGGSCYTASEEQKLLNRINEKSHAKVSQIRGQYRFTDYAENRSANELLLQLIFSLGAHGAHPF